MNLLFRSFREIPSALILPSSLHFCLVSPRDTGDQRIIARICTQSYAIKQRRQPPSLSLSLVLRQISHTQTQTGAAIREHPTSERPKDRKAFAAMKQMRRRTNQLKSAHWKPLDCGTFYHNAAAAFERVPLVAAVPVCSASSSEAATSVCQIPVI